MVASERAKVFLVGVQLYDLYLISLTENSSFNMARVLLKLPFVNHQC